MRFAKLVFLIAGIYGVIAILPGYFVEKLTSQQFPPAITHPEYFYGFFGVALAWQVAFLAIARDPARFRAIIPAAVLEKVSFFGATSILFALGRAPGPFAALGCVDLMWGILF